MTHGMAFVGPEALIGLDGAAHGLDHSAAFARIGGARAVAAVVDEFYDRLRRDPLVADYFSHLTTDNMAVLKRHQVLLLTEALGGPPRYGGRDLTRAHQGLDITGEAYRRVCLHLLTTMHDFRVPMDVLADVDTLLRELSGQIVAAGADDPERRVVG